MRASKYRALLVATGILLALGTSAQADVTGYFETHFSLHPQTTTSEIGLIDFDIENDLTITFVISGLSTTLHTHFGIAGVEDVILTSNATLGALDIQTKLVFARFPYNSVIPFYDSLHFVKKVVDAQINLGGVQFSNTAIFEDTNAFINSALTAYAFGNVISISGATPSGVEVTAEAGICAEEQINRIKKHPNLSPYSVNPECATQPKPDMLFDFENVFVSGVPIAPNVTGAAQLTCVKIEACSLIASLGMAGGPIPFQADLLFVGPDAGILFNKAIISFLAGGGQFNLFLDTSGGLDFANFTVSADLNNSGFGNTSFVDIQISVAPGQFLAALVDLSIERAGLIFSAEATFLGVGAMSPDFQLMAFSLEVPGSLLNLSSSAFFTQSGLQRADVVVRVLF